MTKKTIYINGRFLSQRVTGVQRFAMNLLLSLDKQLGQRKTADRRFVLVTTRKAGIDLKLDHIEKKTVGRLSGHLWEQIELPWATRGGFLLNLCNTGPALKRNQFVTICDAAVFRFPAAYGKIFVLWYRILGFLNARIAKRIITISEFSKHELMHFLGLSERKISIIYPAVKFSDPYQQDDVLNTLALKKKGYFLAVGSMDLKKNFAGIVNAFVELGSADIELVIVGAEHSRVFSNQQIAKRENIKWTGYLEDRALMSLYNNALAFIYPSFYEGFGIPPLEAMTLECPVIVSRAASLPEVCGDAALYCDPYQISSIREAMQKMLTDEGLRNTLKEKGRQRAPLFSYDDSAKKLLDLIQN